LLLAVIVETLESGREREGGRGREGKRGRGRDGIW